MKPFGMRHVSQERVEEKQDTKKVSDEQLFLNGQVKELYERVSSRITKVFNKKEGVFVAKEFERHPGKMTDNEEKEEFSHALKRDCCGVYITPYITAYVVAQAANRVGVGVYDKEGQQDAFFTESIEDAINTLTSNFPSRYKEAPKAPTKKVGSKKPPPKNDTFSTEGQPFEA